MLTMMMSSVIDSDAVIVNKNVCAVAIEYDRDIMDAPIVTAKGLGYFADWIKVSANLAQIPVFQRKKLSLDLFNTVRIYNDIDKRFYYRVAMIYYKLIRQYDNHKFDSFRDQYSDNQE